MHALKIFAYTQQSRISGVVKGMGNLKQEVPPQVARWVGGPVLSVLLVLLSACGQNPAPKTPPREEARSAVSGENPKEDRYDLARDESRGGHTLARHVGCTDEQLAQRLRKERNISAASTWTDRETAEDTVGTAFRAERDRISDWMRRGERRPNLALHYNAGHVIGRSLRRDASESVPCTSAIIVLRANGPDGYYVLTTYPEARE